LLSRSAILPSPTRKGITACFDPEEELDHDSLDKESFASIEWEMIFFFIAAKIGS
jgi:hypothetical protein